MKRLTILLGIILAIAVVSELQADQEMIWGCHQKNAGNFRIVNGFDSCRPSELPIYWYGMGPGVPFVNAVTVDCTRNQTITQALEHIPGSPLLITVKGTCNENVEIVRDDVTLLAEPSGGGINGPDSTMHTIRVRASRTLIDGLTVTGGKHGINVGGSATIQNCSIHDTGRNGINFYHGGHGVVDNCQITNSQNHGILIEGAVATVTNSTISSNPGAGFMINSGGMARIGINDSGTYAGNTISSNGSNGINIDHGGSAFIGGNTIAGNGTNPGAVWGCYGIAVYNANADLVGGNTISGNLGAGIMARSSAIQMGDKGFTGLPSYANTIINNGSGVTLTNGISGGGVNAFLNSSLDIRYTTITGNTGIVPAPCSTCPSSVGPMGVYLNTLSTARMYDDNIDGSITLIHASSVELQNPVVTVQGGLHCFGGLNGYYGNTGGVSGGIDGSCGTF